MVNQKWEIIGMSATKKFKEFITTLEDLWFSPQRLNGKIYNPLEHDFSIGGFSIATPDTSNRISITLTEQDCKNIRALMSYLISISVKGRDDPERYARACDYEIIFECSIPVEAFERLHK
jgi:hypothetical protein